MNPWIVAAGFIIGGGILAYASNASAESDCEVVDEWAYPHLGLAVLLFRVCEDTDGETRVLWDVAHIDDVTIGEDFEVTEWPDESLFTGQAPDAETATDEATAWVDSNMEFIATGGERGPLALRVEDFLAGLSPGQLDELREIFRFEGTAVSDAWPYVTALRVAPTDDDFMDIGEQLGNKLAFLTDTERKALQTDILSAVGFMNSLTLKGILEDAGVM